MCGLPTAAASPSRVRIDQRAASAAAKAAAADSVTDISVGIDALRNVLHDERRRLLRVADPAAAAAAAEAAQQQARRVVRWNWLPPLWFMSHRRVLHFCPIHRGPVLLLLLLRCFSTARRLSSERRPLVGLSGAV